MKKLNHKNARSATVSMLMTLTVCSSVSQASDIDIYSNATGGKTTIMLMLDTSGSMSESEVGGSACDLAPGTSYTRGNEPSGTTPGYTKYFCAVNIPGSNSQRKHYDRLTRLKDAIFTLMDSNQIDSNSVAMGIGQFSSQSGSDNVFTSADGKSGKIVVPAALLSTTQRTAIKTAVANLRGRGGTPTANAYAEVAAYMLGTNTSTASNLGYSGFSKSVLGSKVGSSSTATNYQTPLSTTNTQCNGQGIYFLTDGEPNSSPVPVPLMQAALGTSGSSFSVPSTGTLPNGTQTGHGMPAVGEFAKALRNQTLRAFLLSAEVQ